MNLKKVGLFIKQLRNENKISQQKLADMIPIDRTGLSKWENGETLPPIDKMKILCDIFKISIDELISGERTTQNNKNIQKNNLFNYLIAQDSKYKKLKQFFIILLLILFIIVFLFLMYYFSQTYNTEKVYKVDTLSEKCVIINGLLVITRETSYFRIGAINNEIIDIKILYKNNEKEVIMFEGSSDSLIIDFYGYNGFINNKNFDEVKNNLYLKINEEIFKLYLTEYYKNDNFILKKWNSNSKNQDLKKEGINNEIPAKIKEEFDCTKEICKKKINGIQIDYFIDINTIFLKDKNNVIEYNFSYKEFKFNSPNINFTMNDEKLICNSKSCLDYKNIYEKYYTNIIKKYI